MSVDIPQSLLACLHGLARKAAQPIDSLVPVDSFPLYYLLASEMARMAVGEGEPDLTILVDSKTAMQVDAIDGARVSARHVLVFGALPESWVGAENVSEAPARTGAGESDLFLVILSRHLSLALVCKESGERFDGAWSAERGHVMETARALLSVPGFETPPAFTLGEDSVATDDHSITCAMRLMTVITRQLDMRRRDIVSEKDDISGVLEILKAISAKRRAHDILYVFVEQIARAVQMDRCSVVRVWGEDDKAYVLASHEDERVHDLAIDLSKYPEIAQAMATRRKVIVNDTRRDPLTRPFRDDLVRAGIHSLIVIPVVLFDQNVGSFLLRAARKEGAFSLRDISFCEIVARAAANALERAQLFEDVQRANERLELLAITDGLTGLYNHRYFRERLDDEFARAQRYNLPLSCMLMDIDDFKAVNDTFGHLQGDIVLRGLAECTQKTVRKSDIVARYGGEEFVVIMPQTGIEGALHQAERLRLRIAEWPFEGFPEGYRITVSIGVAAFDPQTMPDCDTLIRVADGGLYDAKNSGRNRVVIGKP
ncbi:MAG: diguanylate cyclase [Nitrospiraceae bacterium]|nr:diguanylate cyclase [Nitrospiraceae bacterium]